MIKQMTPTRLFAFATLIPVALIGLAIVYGGVWVVCAVVYLTALTAGLDEAIRHVTPPAPQAEFPAATTLSVILGVAHFALLAGTVEALSGARLVTAEKIGLFISAGLFFGQISNSNAHELIHRGGRGLHRLGKWVYISLLFGHHTSAHVLVHHRYVATPMDPSTSRLGESYYRFAWRAWRGSYRKGLIAETERQRRIGASVLAHPYVFYVGGSFAFASTAWVIGGMMGVWVYISLAFYSTSQLLLSDYVQHYGLMRRKTGDKFEPVGTRHSWNSPHWFSSALMLNAPRHSDHHAHPSRSYDTLVIPQNSPMLPRSLPVMACVALWPRMWRQVMDPLAAQWSADAPPRAGQGATQTAS